jgi:adenine-specific DNA-methyltransferase
MTKLNDYERVAEGSPNQRTEMLSRLMEAAPEMFTDGKLDLERLKALAGDAVETSPERYGLNWPGKREAIAMLQAPSRATLEPERDQSVNFDEARHVFIEGENLEVLKLLYRAYFGRVKLIYIDPPYNTASDFIYPDDFSDPLGAYLKLTGQVSEDGDLLTNKPDTSGRKHSKWLTMMYPRLALARQFLREDGFIAVSIDDIEVSNLRRLMDEVFGEENFVVQLVYDKNRKNDAKLFSVGHEYMLIFARNLAFLKEQGTKLRAPKEGVEELRAEFERLRKKFDDDWVKVRQGILDFYSTFGEGDPRKPLSRFRRVDEGGPFRTDGDISWPGGGGPRYDVLHPKTKLPVKVPKRGWVYPSLDRMNEEIAKGRVVFGEDESTSPSVRRNIFDRDEQVMRSVIFSYAQTAAQQFDAIFDDVKVFENPKSFTDLERLITYLSGPDDLVMDFFAGSNTTFHGLLRANLDQSGHRRMIAIQMPQAIEPGAPASNNAIEAGFKTIADLSRNRIERVMAAGRLQPHDAGFRVFRLAPSNLRRWSGAKDKTVEAYEAQLDAFEDSLEPGWEAGDVIWQVALSEGLAPTSKVEQIGDVESGFWRVTDGERGRHLTLCVSDALSLAEVRALGLGKDDLFVCRATALDDTLAANLALQCRLKVL